MIFYVTTAVNTGQEYSVVARLQNQFTQKDLEKLQFIRCQHNILDLLLRHLIDSIFPTKSRRTTMNYQFIEYILGGYENLQKAILALTR